MRALTVDTRPRAGWRFLGVCNGVDDVMPVRAFRSHRRVPPRQRSSAECAARCRHLPRTGGKDRPHARLRRAGSHPLPGDVMADFVATGRADNAFLIVEMSEGWGQRSRTRWPIGTGSPTSHPACLSMRAHRTRTGINLHRTELQVRTCTRPPSVIAHRQRRRVHPTLGPTIRTPPGPGNTGLVPEPVVQGGKQ
jgi:hypothetical protein